MIQDELSNNQTARNSLQEVVIDINIKYLKMKVSADSRLKIVWQRSKKSAFTQVRELAADQTNLVILEKFQINTVLDLDPETNRPIKDKMSKLTVVNEPEGVPLAEAELNLSEYEYGDWKKLELTLVLLEGSVDLVDPDFPPVI